MQTARQIDPAGNVAPLIRAANLQATAVQPVEL